MLDAVRSRSAWVRCVPGIVTVQSEVVGAGVFGFLAVWRVLGRGGVVSWEDFRGGWVVGNLKVFWKSALTVPVNFLKCAPLSGQWGRSSVGRAPQWHCGGQEFESPRLHHFCPRARGLSHNPHFRIVSHFPVYLHFRWIAAFGLFPIRSFPPFSGSPSPLLYLLSGFCNPGRFFDSCF